jgi:HEAT repeat protein
MARKHNKENDHSTVVPSEQKMSAPLDTKQIAETVLELNITRKNVQVYPLGHEQVQQSIEKAYQTLLKTLATHTELTLGIAKNSLMIDDSLLDPDNAVFKEFATALSLHGIASLTFEKDVGKDALLDFLCVISKRPSEVSAAGGIEKVLLMASLPKVSIRTIDYSQFYLTEEEQAVRRATKGKSEDDDNIWQDFISHFLSGTLSQSDEDVSVDDIDALSPEQFADALNSGQIGNVTALDTYDRIISKHLRYTSSRRKGSAEGDVSKFGDLNSLLQELSPELRRQFLSVTFNRCVTRSKIPETETFLSGLSQKFVVDMLKQANEEGKEISPSLISLVHKIANIEGAQPGRSISDSTLSPYEPSRKKLQQLFKREDHESFIVPEYDVLLQQVAGTSQLDPETTFPLEEYLETISSPHLDIQVVRVVIAFLEMDIESNEYEDYAEQLLASMPSLLLSGAFSILLIIAETFDRHQKEKPEPGTRSAAESALKRLKDPELITKAIRVVNKMQASVDSDAYEFLRALGTKVVPETVAVLADREMAVENDPLYRVLDHFRQEAIDEVKKRLDDTRIHNVYNLFLILQEIEAKEAANSVRPFLDHPDSIVKMQALKTFLHFENSEAIPYLRRAIQSIHNDISSRAIQWAGQYKIQAVVPDLISKIKRFAVFRSDLYLNKNIFTALGQIGDPFAVEHLEKLEVRSFPLYRKDLISMRRVLFESLEGYPYETVIPLIKTGYRSKDKEIRIVCQRIRRKNEIHSQS